MINYRLMKLIETYSYVNDHGEHIYGTAALLHFLHRQIKFINPEHVKSGKAYVENLLSA